MAGEQPRFIGKRQNPLDALPERFGTPTGEIRACRAGIRHEDGIIHKSGVPDHVGDRSQRVAV